MPEPQYHLAELEIALDPTRPEHILPVLTSSRVGVVDVGCGIGQLFVAKGDEVPPGVPRYGFDIDPTVIEYAKGRWPDRAQFGVAPAEKIPLPDGSVDFYVSRVTLPLADIPAALREAARVLVPGGTLWVTLHPISMTFGQIGRAVRTGRVKELVMRTIVLANGLAFHLFGTGRRILGIRDSWQSESRMRRELDKGFRDVKVTTNGRHFLIEATRR
jgi:SAM-dependent methyltransferase